MQNHDRTLIPADLPSPAPLPSLTTAFSRRNALFGALAIGTGAAAGEIAALALPAILPEPFDADLINHAARTVALAQRHEEAESERNNAQAAIDRWDFANRPEAPELPEPRSRMLVTDLSTPTRRIMQFAEPIEDGDAEEVAACIAFKEARQAHKQAVADKVAASGVPSMTRISDRLWQDLIHAVEQLADMEPATLGGLAAKASVVEVLAQSDSNTTDWGQGLLRSVAEDAIRLHSASMAV